VSGVLRSGQPDLLLQFSLGKILEDLHITEQIHYEVPMEMAGTRIDQVLAFKFQQFSRARLQGWLKEGVITIDGQIVEPKKKVSGGEIVDGMLTPVAEPTTAVAEDIPLDMRYEDEALLVLSKAAGMVMHIAPGNYSGTIQNALLFHHPETLNVPRAGIVHRLDKDTSGLVMVAKTLESHHQLVQQLQSREVHRVYDAVVHGVCRPQENGCIRER